MQLADLCAHLHAQLGIKVRERFIKQEHIRFFDNRAANRHALGLTAGKLARQTVEQLFQLEDFGRFVNLGINLIFRQLAQLETKSQILTHRHVWVERIVLEHHRNTA